MNKLDKQYQDLLKTILEYGVEKKDRTGTGTKSIFGYTIRHKMSEGFPLLTTKKMSWKTMVTELLWFLKGDTNIKYLVDNDCHIWDGDAYKNYENKYYKGEAFGYKKLNNWLYSPDLKLSQEEFIDKCKTDSEFSETWGLKIEERELDMMERWAIADLTPNMEEFDFANYMCDKHNVPTKLITITYNNETIESYE